MAKTIAQDMAQDIAQDIVLDNTISIVKKLLSMGLDVESVNKTTMMPIDEIKKLQVC